MPSICLATFLKKCLWDKFLWAEALKNSSALYRYTLNSFMNRYNYQKIDQKSWKRKRHYALYSNASWPYISFTTPLDITKLYQKCQQEKINFFSYFLFITITALNEIENFRYRIIDREIILFDRVDPSFTVFDSSDELFYFADALYCDALKNFIDQVENAKKLALFTKCLNGGGRQDVVHFSCTPWFDFSDVVQPIPIETGYCIPKVMWGKYTIHHDRITIPFSIMAHHGLVDGFHIAKLFDLITKYSTTI